MAPEQRAGYRVRGLVQGVGFRWWTVRQAQRLGLRGTVRNMRDGSVEVMAAGPPGSLEELHRLLQQGPSGARVSAVEPIDAPEELPATFEIAR